MSREQRSALDGAAPRRLSGLPRRIYLTYRYRGIRQLLYRTVVFPLRLTPLDRVLALGDAPGGGTVEAIRWYRTHGRPVTIVIPSYRDAPLVRRLISAIARTTPRDRVRIVVADDASGPEHVAALRSIGGIEVIEGQRNAGFSANVNRGLRAAAGDSDVVLLNSDVVPRRGWLAALQRAATARPEIGIATAKLLYPTNRIQYAGTIRNPRAPEWFDHRYRGKPADWGPANVPGPTLAATGACMYLRRDALERIGLFDERYPMGYEDVDYGLRAWEAGLEVAYVPAACLHHLESATRGTVQGERELESQRVFWQRWSPFFAPRPVSGPDGRLRIVYVTESTIVGGGHRVVFEHLNGLHDRGHDAQLWTLTPAPDWFELRCPVRTFEGYEELVRALAPLAAIKVATWWRTAAPVWRASVVHGAPAYFVQDIETSYYRDSPTARYAVLDSYRPEFSYLTTSSWNRDRLGQLALESELVSPGVDHGTFRPLAGERRRTDMVLALGRSEPIKNLSLTLAAWRALPAPRPELVLFGSEPELATEPGVRYVPNPTDAQVNELLNATTVFLQTSEHEGFCLPILEAMATGAPVVCTDAGGNRDFCVDGDNCAMPAAEVDSVAAALGRLLSSAPLRERLGQGGIETAARYGWEPRLDAVDRFMRELATRPYTAAAPRATGPRPPSARSG
ncbi:MAG: glycosyltransferase [Solirubrobacteraceae bacterium]